MGLKKILLLLDITLKHKVVFESGAILIYLGEKSGKFYEKSERTIINQWLMGQMAYVGPMLGQHHQFHHYNPGKSEFGEKRYFKISERIYKELDERLSQSNFLAGKAYTIADIATFPWIARHEWHDIVDQASSYTDKSVEMKALNRSRKLISKINSALQRLKDGTYGFCEDTGEPIGLKRLMARPVATLSIEAQEKHERDEKIFVDD
jgi:RNA polymerase-binding protein DksA